MLTSSSQILLDTKKSKKNIILATGTVLFGILAFLLHFCRNISADPSDALSYLAGIILFVTLSANCAAELISALRNLCSTGKYMLIAAVVSAIEVIPYPLCRIYFSFSISEDNIGTVFRTSWIYAAIIFAVILLLTSGINFLRKKCRLNLSVKKI